MREQSRTRYSEIPPLGQRSERQEHACAAESSQTGQKKGLPGLGCESITTKPAAYGFGHRAAGSAMADQEVPRCVPTPVRRPPGCDRCGHSGKPGPSPLRWRCLPWEQGPTPDILLGLPPARGPTRGADGGLMARRKVSRLGGGSTPESLAPVDEMRIGSCHSPCVGIAHEGAYEFIKHFLLTFAKTGRSGRPSPRANTACQTMTVALFTLSIPSAKTRQGATTYARGSLRVPLASWRIRYRRRASAKSLSLAP